MTGGTLEVTDWSIEERDTVMDHAYGRDGEKETVKG